MKRYEQRETVIRKVCVHLQCDLCGRVAEHPTNEVFEWGGAGSASGKLEWHYSIDGDLDADELNLCYECAAAIGETIKSSFQRKKLLEAIGRVERGM